MRKGAPGYRALPATGWSIAWKNCRATNCREAEEVLDCGHIPSDGAEFLQEVINLLLGLCRGPAAENRQQILLVLAARLGRAERRVVLQVRAADHIAHTRPGILARSALQTRADPAVFGCYQGLSRLLGCDRTGDEWRSEFGPPPWFPWPRRRHADHNPAHPVRTERSSSPRRHSSRWYSRRHCRRSLRARDPAGQRSASTRPLPAQSAPSL